MDADSLRRARTAHRLGRFEEAEAGYRACLERDPEDPDANHMLGLLQMQRNEAELAVRHFERTLERAPDFVDGLSNLGHALRRLGRFEAAEARYRQALARAPGHPATENGLALLERATGDVEGALRRLEALCAAQPHWADGHYNRGVTLQILDREAEAAEAFARALAIDPDLSAACLALVRMAAAAGRTAEATALCRTLCERHPELATARHLLAALTGEAVPDRASAEHVREEFDRFADSFDVKLARLNYRVPEQLAGLLDAEPALPPSGLEIVDLGCGTGLLGPRLRARAKRLSGLDLSPGMLDKARKRGNYDVLVEGDLERAQELLGEGCADVVVAADVFIYLGDLQPGIEASEGLLRPGGRLVFSLERAPDPKVAAMLMPSGRYAHAEAYVREVLEACEFTLECLRHAILRTEAKTPVQGLLVRARRSGARAASALPAQMRSGAEQQRT